MKKFAHLGRPLSQQEQAKVFGGDPEPDYCAYVTCYNGDHVEIGCVYDLRSNASNWIATCNSQHTGTAFTSGHDCTCSNCTA